MKYELTFLLSEEADTKTIKELLNSIKGSLIKEEKWGKKILAYPIKKILDAYYFNWLVEVDQNKINELRKKLDFNEKLIRYLLLKTE